VAVINAGVAIMTSILGILNALLSLLGLAHSKSVLLSMSTVRLVNLFFVVLFQICTSPPSEELKQSFSDRANHILDE
jgi:hypothetical protein